MSIAVTCEPNTWVTWSRPSGPNVMPFEPPRRLGGGHAVEPPPRRDDRHQIRVRRPTIAPGLHGDIFHRRLRGRRHRAPVRWLRSPSCSDGVTDGRHGDRAPHGRAAGPARGVRAVALRAGRRRRTDHLLLRDHRHRPRWRATGAGRRRRAERGAAGSRGHARRWCGTDSPRWRPSATPRPSSRRRSRRSARSCTTPAPTSPMSSSSPRYHVDIGRHMETFMAVKDRYLTEPYPAWTAIGVSELVVPGGLVEIRAIAVAPDALGARTRVDRRAATGACGPDRYDRRDGGPASAPATRAHHDGRRPGRVGAGPRRGAGARRLLERP